MIIETAAPGMSFRIRSLPSAIAIEVFHPSGRGSRGVDVRLDAFNDDLALQAALNTLNFNIARWPVAPVKLADVRAAQGRHAVECVARV